MPVKYYRAFGFTISSDLPLENWLGASDSRSADLKVTGVNKLPDSQNPILYSSKVKLSQDIPLFTIRSHEPGWLIQMYGDVDFWITKTEIQVRFDKDRQLSALLRFLSFAMAFWLDINGIRTFHASSVFLNGHAAVFLADSTTGKSTLAASLLQRGGALISDDAVPVEESMNDFLLRPGYASLRLSPAQVKHFIGKRSKSIVSIPKFQKYLVQLGPEGWAPFCDQKIAPTTFYILKRSRQLENKSLEIQPLSEKEAILSLLRFLFFPVDQNFIVNQASRLDFLSRLTSRVPVKRLIYPSGFEYLPAVCEAIQWDLAIGFFNRTLA